MHPVHKWVIGSLLVLFALLSITIFVIGDELDIEPNITSLENTTNQTNDIVLIQTVMVEEINNSVNTTVINVVVINVTENNTIVVEQIVQPELTDIPVEDAVDIALEVHSEKLSKQTKDEIKLADKNENKNFIIKYRVGFDVSKFSDMKNLKNLHIGVVTVKIKDISELLNDDAVEYIELDQEIVVQTDMVSWNVARVGANNSWNQTTGTGIKVAIIDSGISTHDDLRIVDGWNVLDDTNNYDDTYGHGTMVAGVLGATINNQGFIGVSPEVDLYAIKITNNNTGRLSDAIAGLQWAIDNNMNMAVMSFGTASYSQLFKDALQTAHNQGMLLIAASGNDGTNQILYPAGYDDVIAVGATDNLNNRASFSNYGDKLELVAPGVDINSTTLGNTYAVAQGTSLAAPHVAGVAALIWSYNRSLTNDQVRAKLDNDALDLGVAGKDDYYGYGLVQINLSSSNLSLQNTSYYYELYNITDYNLSNQTIVFWKNGTGSIEQENFTPGYYLLTKYFSIPYNTTIYVIENGTIQLLEDGGDLFFYDDYSVEGSLTDAVLWVNGDLNMSVDPNSLPIDIGNIEGECYSPYGDPVSTIKYCWFVSSTSRTNCDTNSGLFNCASGTTCTIGNIGDIRTNIVNESAIVFQHNQARLLYDCIYNPVSYYKTNYSKTVLIMDQKRSICVNSTYYSYQGRSSTAPTWTTYVGPVACADTCNDGLTQTITSRNTPLTPPCGGVCTATNGTIFVNTLDYLGHSLTGLNVRLNNISNTTTDTVGTAVIKISTVSCSADQNVSVVCANNITCGSQLVRVGANNTFRSLIFDCTICANLTPDLYIGQSDVSINLANKTVTVKVHSVGINSSNVVVNFSRQDTSGLIVETKSVFVNVTSGNVTVVSTTLNFGSEDYVHIFVDPSKLIVNDTIKTNNYVFRPVLKAIDAYLNVHTDSPVANDVIIEYISSFVNVVNSSQSANVIIDVGIDQGFLWTFKPNVTRPYAGGVLLFPSVSSAPSSIYVRGTSLDGDIAAVKRLINARNIFLNKNMYHSRSYESYITDYDSLGIGVADHLHNAQAQSYYRQNNSGFQNVVRNILFDNNFEVSIMTVKTLNTTSYNQSTILRVKHVSTDFSDGYMSALNINNSVPIVFSGGIFSNLETWEYVPVDPAGFIQTKTGFAVKMANAGYDVWEIEITGGPNTDCINQQNDTCPNYTYNDLVDNYWPTSIAGILKYSGKNKIDYVGHSNGGRVAFSSLNKYSISGKNNTGYYFDYNSGQYALLDLPVRPVEKFFGIAVPVTLNDDTDFTSSARNKFLSSIPAGNFSIQSIDNQHLIHVRMHDYASTLFWNNLNNPSFSLSIMNIVSSVDNDKISRNLMSFYNDLAIDTNSTFNASGIDVKKLYMFNGNPNDIIVGVDDQYRILNSSYLINSSNKQGFVLPGLLRGNHAKLVTNSNVTRTIMGLIVNG